MELIEYLQQKYQGAESFVENVILPVFGKENFESGHGLDAISDSSLQSMADRTGIKSIILIGTINVPFNNVSIFDITVKDSVQMNRNRVTIQKIVHRIIGTYSSAFMIFHYDDDVRWDWRFTYCYKGANNVEGTDNKRYTFLLGPSQTCKTAAINFQTLASKKDHLTKEDLEAAFDVEALNKEFFNKYKGFYEDFVEYITGKRYVKEKNKWVEKKIHEPHEQMYPAFGKEDKKVRDYIKKMMGRIVFLHFLQKKGWMGVPKGESWGKGDLQFMKHLYEKANDEQKDDFLDLMLEPLFVALDTNRADKDYLFDTKSSGVVKIPYLNGGLFTRDELDEIDTQFPREKFADFLEFLYQYNFTIDENDPSDAQVGIDPEMLGRIFENLLEDNKDKGAYYTPKEIVKYMCKESLKAYLQTDITDEQTRDKINEFVETYDVEKIGGETSELAIELDKRLKDVKICDPAIGSGAFPMGLLKELFYCRGAIENFDDAAAIKRHIIQNNIYGVDIERGAVDIARMRFWLSLIIDEKTPEPLPNFDYKFMKGNSLLSTFNGQYVNVDTKHVSSRSSIIDIRKEKILLSETQQHLFSAFGQEKLIDEVKVKQHILNIIQYQLESELNSDLMSTRYEQQDLFNDNNYTQNKKKAVQNFTPERQQLLDKCKELKRIIEDNNIPLEKRAALDIDFFDWEIMFNDVFSRPTKEGFDIVIANPPYVEAKKLKYIASTLKERGYSLYSGTADLSAYFMELGKNLLHNKGELCFITTNKFFNTGYGSKVRAMLSELRLERIINFEQVEVFKDILVSSVIIGFQNKNAAEGNMIEFEQFVELHHEEFKKEFTNRIGHFGAYPQKYLGETEWSFSDREKLAIKDKIQAVGTPIFKVEGVSVYRGVTTGYNPAFIISEEQRDRLIKEDPENSKVIKNMLQGRNIRKWYYEESNENLIFTRRGFNINDFPTLKTYLFQYYKNLKPKTVSTEEFGRKPGKYEWFEILDNTAYYPQFEVSEKIIWGLTANKWAFAYDDKQHYLPSNGYILTSTILS